MAHAIFLLNMASGTHFMIRSLLLRSAAIFLGGVALAYIIDAALFAHRVAANSAAAFGSVQVYLTTPVKGSRLEIFTDQPQTIPCVHALFPHSGASPCWYLKRHAMQQIN